MRRAILGAVILGIMGVGTASAQAGDAPPVVVKELLRTQTTATGKPLVLPTRNPEVIVSEYTIAPGATLAVHKHPYSRYAVVLEGELRVARPGHPGGTDYKAGDAVIEMVEEWHYGINTGDALVRLIVIDLVDAGSSPTVLQSK